MPARLKPSLSRQLLTAAAQKRGLAVSYAGVNQTVIKFTDERGHSELCIGTLTSRSSAVGLQISKNKQLTIDFVRSLGLQPPESVLYENGDQARTFLAANGTIVVKPTDASQSIGVSVDVRTPEQLEKAVEQAQANPHHPRVLLQQQLTGKLYRLFVLNGKLVAVALRRAAQVVGDGQKTLSELIAELNANPLRTPDKSTPLVPIDSVEVEKHLGSERFHHTPTAGEIVELSPIESMSAGGEAANVTDAVHPEYRRRCEQVATALGLFTCGLDLICDDIAKPPAGNFFPLLETNAKPGLKPHHFPTFGGDPVDIAGLILDQLFPKL